MGEIPTLTHKQALELLKEVCRKKVPVMLWGPPGVGKSYLVKELADYFGAELIDIRLSQVDPTDLRGIPVPMHEEKKTTYYPPSFFPNPKSEEGKKLKNILEKIKPLGLSGKLSPEVKGIIFFDELNLAVPAVQNAAYQLILDRRLGDYELPPDWAIISAGNPRGKTKGIHASPMPSPLANRFVHFELLAPDRRTWKAYMVKKVKKGELEDGVVQALIDFVSQHKEVALLGEQKTDSPWPSPRSWEFAAVLIQGLDPDKDRDKIFKLVSSAVGIKAGKEFIKYLEELAVSVKEILNSSFDQLIKLMSISGKRGTEAVKTASAIVEEMVKKIVNGKTPEQAYEEVKKEAQNQ